MNSADDSELNDKAMAGRLTPEEVSALSDLEEDVALGQALRALRPPPKVSTNFTALVLQQIQERPKQKTSFTNWLRWPVLARATAGLAFVAIFGVVMSQRRENLEVTTGARKFAAVTSAASQTLPPEAVVEVFKDFEAVKNLPAATPTVDYALLAALGSE
jgi:hypothetical protein